MLQASHRPGANRPQYIELHHLGASEWGWGDVSARMVSSVETALTHGKAVQRESDCAALLAAPLALECMRLLTIPSLTHSQMFMHPLCLPGKLM